MSIRTRIPLDCSESNIAELRNDSYVRVELEVDLAYCDDATFEFIVTLYRSLREWVRKGAIE
jgi:hypothetical protein